MRKLANIKIELDDLQEEDDGRYWAEKFVKEMQAIAKKYGLDLIKGVYHAEGMDGTSGLLKDAYANFKKGNDVNITVSYYVDGKSDSADLVLEGTIFGKKFSDNYDHRYDYNDAAGLLEPYFEDHQNDVLIEIAELQKQIDDLKKLL